MENKDKVILDLCGGTGSWSEPYKKAGYDVRVITFPDYDVRLFPGRKSNKARLPKEFSSIEDLKIYGVLCAPPCTVFSGSGAMWKRTDKEMLEGLSIVDACLRIVFATKPKFWALENPVGKLRKWLGKPIMSFNPCDYGDAYKKKTLLWGSFNTNLKKNPVKPIIPSPLHQNYGGKSERTKRMRSITPSGFAEAFYEANK
jgi:site-specific DNA-cytosine methylase